MRMKEFYVGNKRYEVKEIILDKFGMNWLRHQKCCK